MKDNRSMKVYEGSGRTYKAIPLIRLQGEWLKELGFTIGSPVNVKCEEDRLVITRIKKDPEPGKA